MSAKDQPLFVSNIVGDMLQQHGGTRVYRRPAGCRKERRHSSVSLLLKV